MASVNELALAERLSLWLNARVGYMRVDEPSPFNLLPFTGAQNPGVTAARSPFGSVPLDWAHFALFLPIVYQLNRHVGVGIGPDVAIDWAPSPEVVDVRVGLKTWIPISI